MTWHDALSQSNQIKSRARLKIKDCALRSVATQSHKMSYRIMTCARGTSLDCCSEPPPCAQVRQVLVCPVAIDSRLPSERGTLQASPLSRVDSVNNRWHSTPVSHRWWIAQTDAMGAGSRQANRKDIHVILRLIIMWIVHTLLVRIRSVGIDIRPLHFAGALDVISKAGEIATEQRPR